MSGDLLHDPDRATVPRGHPEADEQRKTVQFLRWALPDNAVFFHIPNGGKRHDKATAILIGLGLRAGIPDLCVIHCGTCIFIEMKARRGVLSAVQKQMHQKLSHCGVAVVVCRTVECVETSLRELGVPLRASVTGFQWRPHSRAYDAAQDAFNEWGVR